MEKKLTLDELIWELQKLSGKYGKDCKVGICDFNILLFNKNLDYIDFVEVGNSNFNE